MFCEQGLYIVKAFTASHFMSPAKRLSLHKELGENIDGTADPNSPEGHSRPHGIVLSI